MARPIKELRFKSELFVRNSDMVFICPHLDMDADALASALAFYMIANKNGKKAYIVLDDNVDKFESAVRGIINELPNEIKFMDKTKALRLLSEGHNVLLVMVDTNKKNLVPFESFDDFKDIMIIDHHQTDDMTVRADYTYIDLESSSTSEIMYKLLEAERINMDGRDTNNPIFIPNIANYLLSGIIVDTNWFKKGAGRNTSAVATSLQDNGASFKYVDELLADDYETEMVVQNLVGQALWKSFNFGISYNKQEPNRIYNKEDLAKAADWLLKYRGTDAVFVLGYLKECLVYISARSKGVVNVGQLMHELGGGGNPINAAAAIESDNIEEVCETLRQVITPGYDASPKQLVYTREEDKNKKA